MDPDVKKIIEEQFRLLPAPVQRAITSAEMDEKFRVLAQKYGLHYDQWDKLENQIMLTVLGLAEADEMVNEVVKQTGLEKTRAETIVNDVAVTIFKPIREQLERELEHPEAKTREESGVEAARTSVLAGNVAEITPTAPGSAQAPAPTSASLPPPVTAATPPPPPPTEKAIRMPASGAYKPGEASHTRKDVHDDPYREPPA